VAALEQHLETKAQPQPVEFQIPGLGLAKKEWGMRYIGTKTEKWVYVHTDSLCAFVLKFKKGETLREQLKNGKNSIIIC
jgi:hypothetical protein